MAHHGLGHFGQGFQSLLYPGLAVAAHHAFHLQGLFHSSVLLDGTLFILIHCGLREGSRQGSGVFGCTVVLGAVHIEQIQTQGIAHHAEAGKAHGGGTEHRVQGQAEGDEHTGRQRDADDVVDEGPEQIFVDVAQGNAAQADGGRHVRKPGVHQHHVCRINGNIGACADGDAGIGTGQSRGVVDAIAHHRHLAVGLQLADDRFLAVRQHACNDLVHTGLPPDGVGSALVVAGEHHHADAHGLQLPDGTGTVLLDGVSHCNDAQQTARPAEEEGCLALCGEGCGLLLQLCGHGDFGANKGRIAAKDLHAIHLCGKAVARQCGKVGYLGGAQLPCLGAGQHSLGQRVFALAFQCGGKGEQLGLGNALSGQNVGDLGLTAGDGAGLIQRHDLGAACSFQRSGGLEQDAVFGTQPVAHHDGHRRCQTQRTGAADDQHGDAAGQCIAQLTAQQ